MAKWTLDKTAEQKYAEILTLKSKNSKQRAEIARLTVALERVTKEKLSLLKSGETTSSCSRLLELAGGRAGVRKRRKEKERKNKEDVELVRIGRE